MNKLYYIKINIEKDKNDQKAKRVLLISVIS